MTPEPRPRRLGLLAFALACGGDKDPGFSGGGGTGALSCEERCGGCCTPDGGCAVGDEDDACGDGGETCVDCAEVGNVCDEALCWNEALTDLEIVDDSTLHILDDDDAARLRDQLITFIWWDGSFPTDLRPDDVEEDVDPPYEGTGASRVDRLTIDLGDDYVSRFYHFHPAVPSSSLVIVHQGHGDTLDETGADRAIEYFLEQGAEVLAFYMPLYGEYTGPAASHDELVLAAYADGAEETLDRHPLACFFEPVIAGIGYMEDSYAIEDIAMTGVSGGGWTTTLYAALDPRVSVSMPVAGSLPNYLRTETDLGDYEQYDRELYALVGYLDLYVLGGWGEGRSQLQVLNRYDSCCFWGVRYQDYAEDVHDTVRALGEGSWSVFLDESHQSHTISEHALASGMQHAWARDGVMIVDDLDAPWGAFGAEGTWTAWTEQGFGLTLQSAPAGGGETSATWTFEVEPGTYEVYATWTKHENRASNAPYTVFTSEGSTTRVDQRVAPAGLDDGGVSWTRLGGYTVEGDELTVALTNDADGYVIADGVMIRPAE